MTNSFIALKQLLHIAQILILCFIAVSLFGCSENSVEAIQTELPNGQSSRPLYDSTFSQSYNLYVVSDDTVSYNPQHYYSSLNQDEKAIGSALNEYAVLMLTEYNSAENENTVISPISATMLYSLMSNFTDDKNKENVFKTCMGIDNADNQYVNSFFRKYNVKNHQCETQTDNSAYFSISNNLWMDNKSSVYESFLSMSNFYDFDVQGMDVDNESSFSNINSIINKKIGSENASINLSTIEKGKPLITSTITFNGEWKDKFRVDSTKINQFKNANGSMANCKVLCATRKDRFARFESFDMMEFPYKGDRYSMYIVLPHSEDGLANSLLELNSKGTIKCMDFVRDTTRCFHGEYLIPRDTTTAHGIFSVVDTLISDTIFDIRIPKFKVCSSTALNPQKLDGSSSTQFMYKANLPKVSPNGFTLSNVFQSCLLEMDEEATMASSDIIIDVSYTVETTGTSITPPIQLKDDTFSIPKGKKREETIVVPFNVAYPFAVFIRETDMGTIPYACSIKTLND